MNTDRKIEIAVVGDPQSGKSSLIHLLQDNEEVLSYDEHTSHEDMDCEHHDAVLQVLDATHLEDSLMLTPSLVDHAHHLVIAITHYDRLRQTGHELNIKRMEELIGVPVYVVSGLTGEGVEPLRQLLREVVQRPHTGAHPVVHAWEQNNEQAYRAYVQGMLEEVLIHPKKDTASIQERINRLMTRPLTGFPILAIILAGVFWATFAIGTPIQDWLQQGVDALHDWLLEVISIDWLRSLLADGIVQGVGTLLTALPNIIVLFFFLSVMEDTGYMARVAYLMDGFMHRIGLHGRSFVPMLMGFDCNVPAIIAAKDIQNPQDRALTMLMIPFMSCSARLPVYILFISIFFPHNKALVLGSLYLLGVLLSFVFALIMKQTRWFKHPDDTIINELPDFRMPTAQSIGRHIWYRVGDFLKKISTVVLIASIVIWILQYFPSQDLSQFETSWLASIGKALEPLVRPLGFDWRLAVCLLTGLPAKEAIAATFAILYNGDLTQAALTPAGAYAFLVFTLLYFPCVATITTLRHEINWKWSTFTVVNSIAVAWLMAFIAHAVGNWLCTI